MRALSQRYGALSCLVSFVSCRNCFPCHCLQPKVNFSSVQDELESQSHSPPVILPTFDDFRKHCAEGRLREALGALHIVLRCASFKSYSTAFNWLLQGCLRNKDISTCWEVYSLITVYGLERDAFLVTSLIHVFSNHRLLPEVNSVFKCVRNPDEFTWTALITAHTKNGKVEEAIQLYHRMKLSRVEPDAYVFVAALKACADSESSFALSHGRIIHSHVIEQGYGLSRFVNNTLINMYVRCGALQDAYAIFSKLPKKDAVTWSTIIGGYSDSGCSSIAFQFFQNMQKEGNRPDPITCISALKACSGIAALEDGRMVHSQVMEYGFNSNVIIGSALVDMYAKCGNLEDAKGVFNSLPKRDIVTWTALIAGLSFNNDHVGALQQYKEMINEGLKPTEVVFLSVLSAIGQLGQTDGFDTLFNTMSGAFGIIPTSEHLNCVVNLLGRVGHLKEAEVMLRRAPTGSNVVGWTSLLNNCKVYGELEVGKNCFDQIVEIDSRDASAYTLMSDIYASMGMWKEAMNTRKMKENAQAWKKPGKASIHVNGAAHEFLVNDAGFSCLRDINLKLQILNTHIRIHGHIPQ